MVYGVKADIRAMTGITSSEISDDDLDTIISIADRWVNNYAEGNPSDDDKREASNCFAASIAFQNRAGNLSEHALAEIKDSIKIDTKTASILQQGLSKEFFRRALYILSAKTKTDLVVRVP